MKATSWILVPLITLFAVIALIVVAASSILAAPASNTESKAAAPVALSSMDRYAHNLTGEFVPGRVSPSSKSSFVGNTVPYQAKAWLEQDARKAGSTNSISASDRYGYNLTGEPTPGRIKPWLPSFTHHSSSTNSTWNSPAALYKQSMIGEVVTEQHWMSLVDRYARRMSGEFVPGHLDNSR